MELVRMVSEKQKEWARKWDKENMRNVCCRLRTEDAELFKEYCAEIGTTPAAFIKDHIIKALEKRYGKEQIKSKQKSDG